jgi:hypothetical protein
VDQLDTAEFAALVSASNVAFDSHVPPVLTKTWFHTGTYVGRNRVSNYFAGLVDQGDLGEYFREPGWNDAEARAHLLSDTILPSDLTSEEEREACRSLKGTLIRQEVYGLDGGPREVVPYSVVEQYNYERTLVPVLNGQIVDDATALSDPQVRWLPDPRVTHALTLEVDEFADVLKSAFVAHGRRFSDPALPDPGDDARHLRGELLHQRSRPYERPPDATAQRGAHLRTHRLSALRASGTVRCE